MESTPIFSRQQILDILFKTPHGNLLEYTSLVSKAWHSDVVFLAHATAWNRAKGTVRDAKVGVPVAMLGSHVGVHEPELDDHCLALLACLDPRDLLRAWHYAKQHPLFSARPEMRLKRMIRAYVKAREQCWPWWEKTALWFGPQLKELYRVLHLKPCPEAQAVLFDRIPPLGTLHDRLRQMPTWPAEEVAGFMRAERLPALYCEGVLGARLAEPPILTAWIDLMTPAQFLKRQRRLVKLGAHDMAATRGASMAALDRAAKNTKTSGMLAATKVADALRDEHPELLPVLERVQDAQFQRHGVLDPASEILLCIDKSGSMEKSLKMGIRLAELLTQLVRGKVHVCFFDKEASGLHVDAENLTQFRSLTKSMQADGGTSCAIGLQWAYEKQLPCDVIVFVSDGGDHAHNFAAAYQKYAAQLGKEPPVYLYHLSGEPDSLSPQCAAIPYQRFEADGLDDAGLLALAQTMRTQRYALLDEIMATPLLTLAEALRVPKQFRGIQEVV